MTAEPSTQQRPWAAVARLQRPGEGCNEALVAHFSAMGLAFWRAYCQHIEPGGVLMTSSFASIAVRAATDRYLRPAMAAFTAAALASGWDSDRVVTVLGDGDAIPSWTEKWLTAAGINPDEIAAAGA